MEPREVEAWLNSLGLLIPREAVTEIARVVRERNVHGDEFDNLVKSRSAIFNSDAVRPSHMATLRRCWNSRSETLNGSRPTSAALARSLPTTQSSAAVPTRPGLGRSFAAANGGGRALFEQKAAFAPPPRRGDPALSSPMAPSPLSGAGGESLSEGGSQEDWSPPAAEPEAAAGGSTPSNVCGGSALGDKDLGFRRPAQVPRLDLAWIHDADASKESLAAYKWMDKRRGRSLNGGDASARGFAWANCQDQQRIAEYYGYRDEGFVATMHGLRTDMIRPRVYLGTMADAAYLPLLKGLEITHVLNCAVEAQKAPPPYESKGIMYFLLPLHDSVEQTQALARQRFRQLRQATSFINSVLRGGGGKRNAAVLVHCVQGLSRGAALVCAYLMEYEGLSVDRALAEVQSKHPGCLKSQHWQTCLSKYNAELMRSL